MGEAESQSNQVWANLCGIGGPLPTADGAWYANWPERFRQE